MHQPVYLVQLWDCRVRYPHWTSFIQGINLLVENSSSLRNSKPITAEVLRKLISDTFKTSPKHLQTSTLLEFYPVVKSRPLAHSAGLCLGTSRSTLWLPLDLLLEDAMDGSQVNATSTVEIITGKPWALLLQKKLKRFYCFHRECN